MFFQYLIQYLWLLLFLFQYLWLLLFFFQYLWLLLLFFLYPCLLVFLYLILCRVLLAAGDANACGLPSVATAAGIWRTTSRAAVTAEMSIAKDSHRPRDPVARVE